MNIINDKNYFNTEFRYPGEEFRKIEGYPKYAVSSWGRVISYNRAKPFVRKPKIDRYGYLVLSMCTNGVKKHPTIHRMVAKAFVRNLEAKPAINHIDNDRANNHYKNLEWCTNKENTAHGIIHGKIDMVGSSHNMAIINESKARHIKWLLKRKWESKDIVKYLGVSQHIVHDIKRGKTWKHVIF